MAATRTWKQDKRAASFWGRQSASWVASAKRAKSRRFAYECALNAEECARKASTGGVRR